MLVVVVVHNHERIKASEIERGVRIYQGNERQRGLEGVYGNNLVSGRMPKLPVIGETCGIQLPRFVYGNAMGRIEIGQSQEHRGPLRIEAQLLEFLIFVVVTNCSVACIALTKGDSSPPKNEAETGNAKGNPSIERKVLMRGCPQQGDMYRVVPV